MSIKELDNVLFRLSMVKDELMQGVVAKLLPRLLLQLTPQAWNNVPVRTKFVKILTHLHKRLTSLTEVQIPIAQVLELFTGQQRTTRHDDGGSGGRCAGANSSSTAF